MTPPDSQPPPGDGAHPKSVLHCPECGHKSLVDGDWQVERVDAGTGHERLCHVCPDCGYVIDARRPRQFARV